MYITNLVTDTGVIGSSFHLDMENGSIPEDGRCVQHRGISTHVILLCNSSANWTNQDLGNNFHVEHSDLLDPCTVSRTTIELLPYSRKFCSFIVFIPYSMTSFSNMMVPVCRLDRPSLNHPAGVCRLDQPSLNHPAAVPASLSSAGY